MLILALLKRLVPAVVDTHAAKWPRGQYTGTPDLEGQTVGIVGFGAIGRAVAKRLSGFDCEVLYYSRRRAEAEVEARLNALYLPFDELLAASSIVTLHVPLNDETYKLIGEEELARMPKGALLVNTARGDVVDEPALLRVLQSGHLGGAALDVIEVEAAGPNPLFDLPNVIVTPHAAGSSRLGGQRSLQHSIDNLLRYYRGEEPLGVPSELKKAGV